MNRINLIGASGSGTSTLGIELAKHLGCPHLDSDDYFHVPTDPPFCQQRTPEERLKLVVEALSRSTSWVLSGSVMGWGDHPSFDFTLMIFVLIPQDIRLKRLRARELDRFGDRIRGGGRHVQRPSVVHELGCRVRARGRGGQDS